MFRWRLPAHRKGLLIAAGSAAALGLVVTFLSVSLPGFLSKDYDQKSLSFLKERASAVRREFSSLLAAFETRVARFGIPPIPAEADTCFKLFKAARLDPATEGIALANPDRTLSAWYGNVPNFIDLVSEENLAVLRSRPAALLVKSKASVYLIALRPAGSEGAAIVHFKLVAFVPRFQSSTILGFDALRGAAGTSFDVDYWDFKEDISGFEKFFARNKDEFIGQPRQKNEIQTLFFPLRNESGRILATATLSSPSLTSKLTSVRENLRLVLFLLLAAAALLCLIYVWSSPGLLAGTEILPGIAAALLIASLRVIALPIVRLGRVQSMAVFSPLVAGFRSPAGLAGSPADILLTALGLFALTLLIAAYGRRLFEKTSPNPRPALGAALQVFAGGLAAAGIIGLQAVLRHTVFNSNLSLVRWSFSLSFLFIHLGLLLLVVSFVVAAALLFRLAAFQGLRPGAAYALMGVSACAVLLLARGAGGVPVLALHLILLSFILAVACFPALIRRREAGFLGLLLAALWTSLILGNLTVLRTRALLETTVKRSILSQETWGKFLVEQSFPELDRSQRSVIAFFKNPVDADFARSLWEKCLVAKFNWYSSLEIRDAEGTVLSRFSLNVPKFYGRPPELEPSEDWSVVRQSMNFIGKEKEFLVGYRDWRDETHYLGRVIFYVSLDPEMLPFLYSANPYFEVLRTDPMPSLNQFDFGSAIYDLEGNPLFNPQKLTAGLAPADLDRLGRGGEPFWSGFREGGTAYAVYLFRAEDRIYGLFTPVKDLKARLVEFLRLFFYYLAVAAAALSIVTLLAGRARLKRPFRSFSNRVYAAFFAVALIPLLMYTYFTRNLFDRIFAQRYVEDAAIHASYAQGLMEAFLVIQGTTAQGMTEVSPSLAPSEDLALWISSTLQNDVNLYGNAVLLASSRREFFDNGLLPDLLDGEAFHDLVYGKKPFVTERTTIGGYSFQTLTVPYQFKDSILFISLPFPFEQQETARATRGIVEFLVLISAFFMALVILFSRGIRSMIIVPVGKLVAGTREVGLGNLEVSIDHQSRDEMMTLIEGFNTMVQNLRAHEQELAEMSKKVAWTEMARKVAHEIKNPLTPIQLSAEHVLKVYDDKKGDFDRALRESMSYIVGEVENLRRIAQEFMEISRDTTLHKDPLDLRDVIDETLRPYRKLLSERIRFRTVYEGPAFPLRGDATKLRTAFRNIIANAVEAISKKGAVDVTVSRTATGLEVVISDTGSGMSRETMERIFDPYFSTKDSGTGLGLPIVKKIIEEHGGAIHVVSQLRKGTTVTIDLPAED